jgi:glycosyltransferase involved in cell wall biosynthesis
MRGVHLTRVIAILPAFNEEITIGSIVLLAKEYVDTVIVVDDGSSDRTATISEKAGAQVIIHENNAGKGCALKTGFETASRLGADIIVTMDTDGQHNPEDIPKLTSPILDGTADMVIGSRYLNGHATDTPSYRRLGQTVLDVATSMNSGVDVTDSQSGFRAFAASTANVFRFKADGMAIESEMLADAGNASLRIMEVEIEVRYDVDCSTENPISHGFGVLVKILKDMEFKRPLYYFTLSGIVIGAIGVYMGLTFLQTFYQGGSLNFGPTMVMILLTLIGTFMAFTGIMLDSMARLMKNTKNK